MLASPSRARAALAVARRIASGRLIDEPERQRGHADARHGCRDSPADARPLHGCGDQRGMFMRDASPGSSTSAARPVGVACASSSPTKPRSRSQLAARPARACTPAAGHHRDAVGEQDRFGHVMGDHDGGQAKLLVQAAVIVAERIAGEGVERAEGLSISMMRGRAARARATLTRWRWPPDNSCGSRSRYWPRSSRTRSSSSSTRLADISCSATAEELRRDADIVGHASCADRLPLWNT